MSNWYIDYKVKYFFRFRHANGHTEMCRNIIIIEARSEDEARKKILYQYEYGHSAMIDFPAGWDPRKGTEEFGIDEIEKVWEY